MSSTLIQQKTMPVSDQPPSVSGFPAFRPLALTACAANTPVVAWLLLAGRLGTAFSVLAGLVVGLAVYGSLHLFIGRGLEPLFASVRGRTAPAAGGTTALFSVLLPFKFILLGGLMYLLVRVAHLSIIWLVIGFLVTQVAVTVTAVRHLSKQRSR